MKFKFFLSRCNLDNNIYRCEYCGYSMEVSVPVDIAKNMARLEEIFLHTVYKNIAIGMPEL